MKFWYSVYREIATALHELYQRQPSSAGRDLYKKCIADSAFTNENKWVAKFEPVFDVRSLDPVHIFSSFNGNNPNPEVRKNKINVIRKLLDLPGIPEEINLEGCPFPFTIHMLGARDENSQKEVWTFFDAVMNKGQNGLDSQVFKKMKNWYGIDVSSLTIFLFWIDPSNFIPLDSVTAGFLLSARKIEVKPTKYEQYILLLAETNTDLYREIALQSYLLKLGMVKVSDLSLKLRYYLGLEKEMGAEIRQVEFKIVAIRLLEGTLSTYKKILSDKDQLYQFYNAYHFFGEDVITFDSKKEFTFYRVNNLSINISAVVGRNGSGKSTLGELFFIMMNNISCTLLRSKSTRPIKGVNMELFVHAADFYKLTLNIQGKVNIYRYERDGSNFSNPSLVGKDFNTGQLFYTIAINYSHYALNSKYLPWVDSLFHKNDAYQIPIAINPMRMEGNINVNREDSLVKSRLIATILEPVEETEENSEDKLSLSSQKLLQPDNYLDERTDKRLYNLRYLTDDRQAHSFLLTLDEEKFKFVYDEIRFSALKKDKKIILEKVYAIFKVTDSKHPLAAYIEKYILKKLVKITLSYPHYKGYFNLEDKKFDLKKIDRYLRKLATDKSHITYKLRQTINFLKYRHLNYSEKNPEHKIDALSDAIRNIKKDHPAENLQTIELIPPPMFTADIKLDDGSNFQDLSSGEKQRIYTLSSLIYHLANIDSVSKTSKLVNYNYVTILFDEVELYYHPEMQRTFIHHLLRYLAKVDLGLQGLNFCFVTHSPLILSDIPSSNILFLTSEGLPKKDPETINTFGANIHELLSESFFLENGFIGELARQKIQDAIDNLQKEPLHGKYNLLSKDDVFKIINLIGEPFLKEKLLDMYYAKYSKEELLLKKQLQLEALTAEIKMMGHE